MAAALPPHPEPETGEARGPRNQRLGEILLDRGKIEAEDIERALELQLERGDKIGKILVDMGTVAHRDVLAALSDQLDIPLVAVDGVPPSAPEIEGMSHRFLRQCRAIPVALVDNTLTIAMADPLDFETIAAVRAYSTRIWSAVAERSGDTAFRTSASLRKRRGAALPAAVQKLRLRRKPR